MRLFGVLSVMSRRMVVALGVAGMMMIGSAAQAQDPTPPAAAAAQPEAPDLFKFDGTSPVMLMLQINSGQDAAFEQAFDEIRKGLAASEKPELQAQAKSMTLLKLMAEMPAGQPRLFFIYLDPPVVGVSYDWTQILYYSGAWKADDIEGRKVVDAIFEKLKASVGTQQIWPLSKK